MTKVLIIGNTDTFSLNLIRSLAPYKVETHLFDRGRMWSVFLSRNKKAYTNTASLSPENLIAAINAYCLKHAIQTILPSDYRAAVILAGRRDTLAPGIQLFPGTNIQTLELLHNKVSFAQFAAAKGLPHPKTFIVHNFDEMIAIDISFPCLVKPAQSEGGNFDQYAQKNREAYLAFGRANTRFPLIVQEFVPGKDLGLNILAQNGKVIAYTMQENDGPDKMKFFHSDDILKIGEQLVQAAHFEGAMNIDLRLDTRDGTFKLIECNPRFWNSLYASTSIGVNFPALGLGLETNNSPCKEDQVIPYFFPAFAMRRLLTGKLSWKALPALTKKDLLIQLTDPLSFLYTVFFQN